MSNVDKKLTAGFPLPMMAALETTAIGRVLSVIADNAGRLIVAGTRQGATATPQPIPSVPFYPMTGMGQVIAIGAVAVTSGLLTLNREHCIWATQNCWIRVFNGAAVNDFPLPAGAVFTYTPTIPNMQRISVIQMAALGGNLYIGQSEET